MGGERRPDTGASPNTTTAPESTDLVAAHPWARRADAAEVEERYQRSVHYWNRRPRPDWTVVGSRTIQVTASVITQPNSPVPPDQSPPPAA